MSCALHVLLLLHVVASTTLTGQVVEASGEPIPEARVFYEPGIGGALQETRATEEGHFRFTDLPLGGVGVFAIAPGWSFGGRHVQVNLGDNPAPLRIVLHRPASVSGRVEDPGGDAVEGARVTRIALLGEHMVGIPLAKLQALGFEEPRSDQRGRFAIENLPRGGAVAVKVAHSAYAQESQEDIPVGSSNLRLTMHPGSFIEGMVESLVQGIPVADTAIIIRNAQPPHDTITVLSDEFGRFTVRLKPGVYLYQAAGLGIMSPGWEQLVVTGELPHPRMNLRVAGMGRIRGIVRDAVSSNPISDVRITLMSDGNVAAVARTSSSGEFLLEAAEGENRIRIAAAPGYRTPSGGDTVLTLEAGETFELPDFWLAPLGDIRLDILDADGETPLPQAVVSLLAPRQYGLHRSNDAGRVSLRVQQIPESGRVVGLAEDAQGMRSGLFSIQETDMGETAQVQVLDNATVRGRIVNDAGRGLSGLEVGGIYPGDEDEDPVLLWRSYTDATGYFEWLAQTPGVPMHVVARDDALQTGESDMFIFSPGEHREIGEIVVSGGQSAEAMQATMIDLNDFTPLCPDSMTMQRFVDEALLLCFVTTAELPVMENALAHLRAVLGAAMPEVLLVLPTQTVLDCESYSFPISYGPNQGKPTTYMLDSAHQVKRVTDGVPPLSFVVIDY